MAQQVAERDGEGAAPSAVTPPAINLPKGGGAIKGIGEQGYRIRVRLF